MADQITKAMIEEQIPIALRGIFIISVDAMTSEMVSVVRSFGTALNIMLAVTRLDRRIAIFFSGKLPFRKQLANGELIFMPDLQKEGGVINAMIENLIFFNCQVISKLPFELQVATILEELVHCVMLVQDETVTSKIVTFLWPKVDFVNGQYSIRH